MLFQIATILICSYSHLVRCSDIYSKFQQTDYKIEFTRLESTWYNKDIYKKFEIVTFKYNRTFAVANLTLQQKVQLNVRKFEIIIQVYKFLSNEYRIYPIRLELNLCRLMEQNIVGIFNIISRCGNITECDFTKDVIYHTCNIHPDQSKFPPLIPSGEYKVELTTLYDNKIFSIVNGYGKVFRPVKIH